MCLTLHCIMACLALSDLGCLGPHLPQVLLLHYELPPTQLVCSRQQQQQQQAAAAAVAATAYVNALC
jgi:hypothetical protein